MTRILIVVALAAGLLLGWLLLTGASRSPASLQPESQPAQLALPLRQAGQARTYVVLMRADGGFRFDPPALRLEPGDSVLWFNLGDNHSTTAYHPANRKAGKVRAELRIPPGAKPWDSGILGIGDKGLTFERTFQIQGTYDYYCLPHEFLGMVGRLVVGQPGGPAEEKPLSAGLSKAAQQKMPSTALVMTGLGNWAAEINQVLFQVFQQDHPGALKQVKALLAAYRAGQGQANSLYAVLQRSGAQGQFAELLAQYGKLLQIQGSFEELSQQADQLKTILTQAGERLATR